MEDSPLRGIQREHELREPLGGIAVCSSRVSDRMSPEKHSLDMNNRATFLNVWKKIHEEEKSKVNSKGSRRKSEKKEI